MEQSVSDSIFLPGILELIAALLRQSWEPKIIRVSLDQTDQRWIESVQPVCKVLATPSEPCSARAGRSAAAGARERC